MQESTTKDTFTDVAPEAPIFAPESLTTPPPPAPPPSLPNAPWMSKLSVEDRAFLENKKFLEPEQLLNSYKNLEKHVGVSEDRLLKIPERSDDVEGWKKIHKKLGVPETPDEYELPDAMGGDADLTKWARESFHKNGIPKETGKKLVQEFDALLNTKKTELQKQEDAKFDTEHNSLKKDWGLAYEQNLNTAKSVVAKLKAQNDITDDMIKGMEKGMGFANTLKHFHNLGTKMSEHKFVPGMDSATGKPILSPEAAKQQLDNFRNTETFKRLMKGDPVAREEHQALIRQAYPEAAVSAGDKR